MAAQHTLPATIGWHGPWVVIFTWPVAHASAGQMSAHRMRALLLTEVLTRAALIMHTVILWLLAHCYLVAPNMAMLHSCLPPDTMDGLQIGL